MTTTTFPSKQNKETALLACPILMDLTNYLAMDPHLLFGLVNTELRNHCDSLDDLVKTHALNQEALEKQLRDAGYTYHPDLNQFR